MTARPTDEELDQMQAKVDRLMHEWHGGVPLSHVNQLLTEVRLLRRQQKKAFTSGFHHGFSLAAGSPNDLEKAWEIFSISEGL